MILLFSLLFACNTDKVQSFVPGTPESDDLLGEHDLSDGIYAMRQVSSSQMQSPIPGQDDWVSVQTFSHKRLDLQRNGTEIRFTEEICSVHITEAFGTETILPPDLITSVSGRTRSGYISDEQVGAQVIFYDILDLNGVILDDPINDPMPSSASSDAIWDQDADGNPGVTVWVDLGLLDMEEIYVAQRIITDLDGLIINPERMEGYLQSEQQQLTLGASRDFLAEEQNTREDREESHSWFVIQRIDEQEDCDYIVNNQKALFD